MEEIEKKEKKKGKGTRGDPPNKGI